MGMSPSADLYWGFDLGDLTDPETYDSLKPSWMDKAWSASRDELGTIVGRFGVELDTYGYGDEPSYCVRIKASVQRAYDWGSVELGPLTVDPQWREQITEFMRLLDLPVPPGKEPGWHMNCSYG